MAKDKIWLENRCVEGLTREEMSKLANCSTRTISRWVSKFNISMQVGKPKISIDKDWLYHKYSIEKLSTLDIANLCGYNEETIRNRLIEFNIPIRSRVEGINTNLDKNKLYRNKEWLYDKYVIKKMLINAINKQYFYSRKIIRLWMDKHRIEKRIEKGGYIAAYGYIKLNINFLSPLGYVNNEVILARLMSTDNIHIYEHRLIRIENLELCNKQAEHLSIQQINKLVKENTLLREENKKLKRVLLYE